VSKYRFSVSDIYLAGTDIPKNLLGITEAEVLHEVEEALLHQAYQTFITESAPDTRFDEAFSNRYITALLRRFMNGLASTAPST
jgi:cell filamentation protein